MRVWKGKRKKGQWDEQVQHVWERESERGRVVHARALVAVNRSHIRSRRSCPRSILPSWARWTGSGWGPVGAGGGKWARNATHEAMQQWSTSHTRGANCWLWWCVLAADSHPSLPRIVFIPLTVVGCCVGAWRSQREDGGKGRTSSLSNSRGNVRLSPPASLPLLTVVGCVEGALVGTWVRTLRKGSS